LVSSSIVTYRIRKSFFVPRRTTKNLFSNILGKLYNTTYLLSLKEWYMDELMHHSIWNLFKRIGRRFLFINKNISLLLFVVVIILVLITNYIRFNNGNNALLFSTVIALISLIFAFRSFVEKAMARMAWLFVLISQLVFSMAISSYKGIDLSHSLLFMSGIIIAGLIGIVIINYITKEGNSIDLKWYKGLCYEYPKLNVMFLICTLCVYGFPVSPTFIGVEIIYNYLHSTDWPLSILFSIIILINSLSLLRIYSRLFLGPHIRKNHEAANLSA
jgi:hypothetical protein